MKRILVADDDEPIRQLLAAMLKRRGYEVETAADGQEAIERLDASRFDAVVLDFMMPRVTGVGVVEHLRKHRPDLLGRTVIITAFPKVEAQLRDVSRVLRKPFDVEDFLRAVEELPAA